jgi:hypothetical protein
MTVRRLSQAQQGFERLEWIGRSIRLQRWAQVLRPASRGLGVATVATPLMFTFGFFLGSRASCAGGAGGRPGGGHSSPDLQCSVAILQAAAVFFVDAGTTLLGRGSVCRLAGWAWLLSDATRPALL